MSDAESAGSKKGGAFSDWCNRWFDPLSKLGLAGAAVLAVLQYLQVNDLEKSSRTFEYIEDFERGSTAEARRSLNATLRPYVDDFIELERVNDGIRPEDRNEILLAIIEDAADDSAAGSIDTVVDFYEGLMLCVDERLCDRSSADKYFCSGRALEFWDTFEPYVLFRRENNASYASALEACARKAGT
ncbi:MAG: hypothetical protein AAFX44_11315 [Pseudomonadota bacterium]